jgi:hypothetical protein
MVPKFDCLVHKDLSLDHTFPFAVSPLFTLYAFIDWLCDGDGDDDDDDDDNNNNNNNNNKLRGF